MRPPIILLWLISPTTLLRCVRNFVIVVYLNSIYFSCYVNSDVTNKGLVTFVDTKWAIGLEKNDVVNFVSARTAVVRGQKSFSFLIHEHEVHSDWLKPITER